MNIFITNRQTQVRIFPLWYTPLSKQGNHNNEPQNKLWWRLKHKYTDCNNIPCLIWVKYMAVHHQSHSSAAWHNHLQGQWGQIHTLCWALGFSVSESRCNPCSYLPAGAHFHNLHKKEISILCDEQHILLTFIKDINILYDEQILITILDNNWQTYEYALKGPGRFDVMTAVAGVHEEVWWKWWDCVIKAISNTILCPPHQPFPSPRELMENCCEKVKEEDLQKRTAKMKLDKVLISWWCFLTAPDRNTWQMKLPLSLWQTIRFLDMGKCLSLPYNASSLII